jgi:adenylosuccinate synthase
MKVDVILGLQWGDEGKGKIVDVLAPGYDIIARFQGGPNAGHTLEFNNNKVILHTIPSGIFHEDKINVIGNGVVIDPVIFARELELVESYHPNARKRLCISKRAHLILPTHRLLDAAQEKDKGAAKIGSTLKGISPAYTDKYSRNGLRVGDTLKKDFKTAYEALRCNHLRLVQMLGSSPDDFKIDGMSFSEFEAQWKKDLALLSSLQLIDSEVFLNEQLRSGKRILAEGAQGTLLDIDLSLIHISEPTRPS